jgi:hypothetical protein
LIQIQDSRLFIHNHPDGDSFSSPDLRFILENGIEEIRACSDKIEYKLKLKKEIQDDEVDKIVEKYINIINEIKGDFLKLNTSIKYRLAMNKFMEDDKINEVFSYEKRKIQNK